MQSLFASSKALELLATEVRLALATFVETAQLPATDLDIRRAADYLVEELSRDRLEFITSKYALNLVESLKQSLDDITWRRYQLALERMLGWPGQRWQLSTAWLQALLDKQGNNDLSRYIPEAV